MITTRFYTKDFDSKKGNQLYAKLYDSTNPTANIRIGLKAKVFKECWDKEEQVARMNKLHTKQEVEAINKAVKEMRDAIDKIIHTIELRGDIVTASRVKDLFDNDMDDYKKEIAIEDRLNLPIEDFYAPFGNACAYRSGAKIGYRAFATFEKKTRQHKVKEINFALVQKYTAWLKEANDNSDSTIRQRLKAFKGFVHNELVLKLKCNIDSSYKLLKVKSGKPPVYRMTIDQFNTFFQITGLPQHLKDIKDWMILATCFGGNRISTSLVMTDADLDRVKKTVHYLEMKKETATETSEKEVVNPLNEYAIHILNERNWKLPEIIQGQHFNEGLKEIIRRSELKDEYFTTDEGKKKNVKVYLRDQISSKIARKNFVSFNEDLGINRNISNAMSNHSSDEGNASDSYRKADPKKRWEMKLAVVEKWNQEYYKMYPSKIPKKDKQVFKLANGKELILINGQLLEVA